MEYLIVRQNAYKLKRYSETVTERFPSEATYKLQTGTGIQQTGTEKDQTVTEKVVYAVANAEGMSPTELRPLVTVIDPDALERLFRDPTGNAAVEFTYQGYQVRVSSDEQVTVSNRGE